MNGLVHETADGLVLYWTCALCDSVCIWRQDGSFIYPLKSTRFHGCGHDWLPMIGAWSLFTLSPGDVLLIHKGSLYSAVRVLDVLPNSNKIRYEWYHQPEQERGTFNDEGVERGTLWTSGQISFKDIKIPYDVGKVWYDYYYGGKSPATKIPDDPHYIAFVGAVEIDEIDASDPGWIYKTWEDGKPNGYVEEAVRAESQASKMQDEESQRQSP